jgi:adenylate cyclase
MVANRRIAVITYLDVVGYTRLIQKAENAMLAEIVAMTNDLVIPTLPSHGGELFKTLGDACLIEFRSAVDAVRWTMGYQEAMAKREFTRIRETIRVRAAIALADVIVGDGDRYGMGMNFVARLQRVSPPGGIVIPFMVRGHLTHQIVKAFRDAGTVRLKDIEEPVPIWTWRSCPSAICPARQRRTCSPPA